MGRKGVGCSAHSDPTIIPPEAQELFTPALVAATPFLVPISFEFVTTGGGQQWAADRKQTHPTGEADDHQKPSILCSCERSVLKILWSHEYTIHSSHEETCVYRPLDALHFC